mmetsp:Transcript_127004/g.247475  ORF Transcript_127004/g.247475 Transcript_127004/m.247475 type:complete len:202 (-) Transcript_127004:8-613(-)
MEKASFIAFPSGSGRTLVVLCFRGALFDGIINEPAISPSFKTFNWRILDLSRWPRQALWMRVTCLLKSGAGTMNEKLEPLRSESNLPIISASWPTLPTCSGSCVPVWRGNDFWSVPQIESPCSDGEKQPSSPVPSLLPAGSPKPTASTTASWSAAAKTVSQRVASRPAECTILLLLKSPTCWYKSGDWLMSNQDVAIELLD